MAKEHNTRPGLLHFISLLLSPYPSPSFSHASPSGHKFLVTRKRGGHWDFRFWIFFWSVFQFVCQKTSVFRFWCSMRFADFSFFSIWLSVFVKNTSGFSVLVPNVVFGFSYFFFLFGPIWVYSFGCGFRFWPILFLVLRFWMNFSSVLRFLLYPNAHS